MRIGLAQIRSERGNLQGNIDHHLAALEKTATHSVELVVFPELSLTNYDPGIAGDAAIDALDARLDVFQRFADRLGTAVVVGAPLKSPAQPMIAMVVFRPGEDRRVIGKQYLHADEAGFFTPASGPVGVLDMDLRIGLAICYEISVPEHAAKSVGRGVGLYLASVAKTAEGVAAARASLSATARRYTIPVLMVNCVGTCEGKAAGGGSMVIDEAGRLVAQLGGREEGVLLYDTVAHSVAFIPAGNATRPAELPGRALPD
jgi:predicted amidohydrolase